MTAARWFALGGSLLQIGGFLAVVMAATFELATEYGDYGPLGKLWLRIKGTWLYWLGTLPTPVQLSGTMSASVGTRASLTMRKSPESEVERIDRELGELRTRVEHFQEDAEKRFGNIEQSITSLQEHVADRTDELQKRLDDIRRGTLRKERRGAWAFVLGTALVLVGAFV